MANEFSRRFLPLSCAKERCLIYKDMMFQNAGFSMISGVWLWHGHSGNSCKRLLLGTSNPQHLRCYFRGTQVLFYLSPTSGCLTEGFIV